MPITGQAKLRANERYRQAHKAARAKYMRLYMRQRRRQAKEQSATTGISAEELHSIFADAFGDSPPWKQSTARSREKVTRVRHKR